MNHYEEGEAWALFKISFEKATASAEAPAREGGSLGLI
jgi:hypothetical protein